MSRRQIDRVNQQLAQELGHEHGYPRYQWKWSEHLELPMRDRDGKMNQRVSEGGLIEMVPVFVKRKMAPQFINQWVICKWLDPGPEATWREVFGKFVPYPREGYYAPTNVALDEGLNPWDATQEGLTVTQGIIHVLREQAKKSYMDHYRDGEKIVEFREREKDRILSDMIDDLKLPAARADHIPGQKDGASFPTTKQTGA